MLRELAIAYFVRAALCRDSTLQNGYSDGAAALHVWGYACNGELRAVRSLVSRARAWVNRKHRRWLIRNASCSTRRRKFAQAPPIGAIFAPQ